MKDIMKVSEKTYGETETKNDERVINNESNHGSKERRKRGRKDWKRAEGR